MASFLDLFVESFFGAISCEKTTFGKLVHKELPSYKQGQTRRAYDPFQHENNNANLGELTHIQGILLPKLHTRISKHFGHLKITVFLPTKMHTRIAKYLGNQKNVCTYSSILLPKIIRNTTKAIFATY